MKSYLKATIITVCIALMLYVGVSLLLLGKSAQNALLAREQTQTLVQQMQSGQFREALNSAPVLHATLTKAQSQARWSRWLSVLPYARQPYLAYKEALSAGVSLSDIASQFAGQAFDPSDLAKLALLNQEEFVDAVQAIQRSITYANRVSPSLIPARFEQDWASFLDSSQYILAALTYWQPYFDDIPKMLGAYEPYDMLVLLQNPHELRPTGGFIGTYGRLTLDHGSVTQFYTDDIYNLDVNLLGKSLPTPPQPLQEYLLVDGWYVRDSNWSPDFPTSAQKIIELYTLASGEEDIDMVVAVSPGIVEAFLDLTGPATVDGITFTSKNLIDELEYRVEQDFWKLGLKDEQRKKIINDLAQLLKQRLFAMNVDQATQFFGAIKTLLSRNEISMYSTDAALQRQVYLSGWAGELRSSANDYLFIVDANLGALKTDRLVDRSFTYEVREQTNGDWLATVRMTYTNNGFFDYRTSRYRTYTRLYVPIGSTFVTSVGFMERDRGPATAQPTVYSEEGKMVIAGFISVEPKQTRTVTVSYILPPWLTRTIRDNNAYGLTWQKQPGTKPKATFTLESKEKLYSFAPSQLSYKLENPNRLRVDAHLETDQQLYVVFH